MKMKDRCQLGQELIHFWNWWRSILSLSFSQQAHKNTPIGPWTSLKTSNVFPIGSTGSMLCHLMGIMSRICPELEEICPKQWLWIILKRIFNFNNTMAFSSKHGFKTQRTHAFSNWRHSSSRWLHQSVRTSETSWKCSKTPKTLFCIR